MAIINLIGIVIEVVGSSLEHAYKYILSNLTAKCLHNDSSGVVNGKFYMEDCNCDSMGEKHIWIS
jgi:hypothetical protein